MPDVERSGAFEGRLVLWSAVAERSVDTAFETGCGGEPTDDIASA
jgi:hypothetical protein